mmetsp:Transcript_34928/g.99739  ORF Transcript_34928/g.99739 Transcript_34928/m.99739 type:complete len:202 (-) Transcript_34928:509-1114(-)
MQQQQPPHVVLGPVRVVAQRLVHVAHALHGLGVTHAAVPVDVHAAPDGAQLLLDHLAAHSLGRPLAGLLKRQLPPRQKVRDGDLVAVERHPEEGLVQLDHVPPDLHVCVHRPLARLVRVLVGVWEWVLLVELRRVPRQQRQDEESFADGCREDVNTELIACAENRIKLGDGVWVAAVLRVVDVHLMVSNRIKYTAEFCLQG